MWKRLGSMDRQWTLFQTPHSISIQKANSILGLIRRSFKHNDCSNMPQLYKTMVRPHLEYGSTVWWPTLKCQRSELGKKHRATKLIPELKHLPYEQRLTILNMPTITFRHLRGTMIDPYKYATHKYKWQSFSTQPLSQDQMATNLLKTDATQ